MSFTRKKVRLGLAAASVALAANVAPANAAVIYSGEVNIDITTASTLFIGIDDTTFIFRGSTATGDLAITHTFKTGTVYIPTVTGSAGDPAVVVAPDQLIELSIARAGSITEGFLVSLYGPSGDYAFSLGEGGIVPFANSDEVGWIRFASDADAGSVVLVDYAYEDVRGASIRAGDTGVSPVPLPATLPLGLAGLGMLGLFDRFKRRRK